MLYLNIGIKACLVCQEEDNFVVVGRGCPVDCVSAVIIFAL